MHGRDPRHGDFMRSAAADVCVGFMSFPAQQHELRSDNTTHCPSPDAERVLSTWDALRKITLGGITAGALTYLQNRFFDEAVRACRKSQEPQSEAKVPFWAQIVCSRAGSRHLQTLQTWQMAVFAATFECHHCSCPSCFTHS